MEDASKAPNRASTTPAGNAPIVRRKKPVKDAFFAGGSRLPKAKRPEAPSLPRPNPSTQVNGHAPTSQQSLKGPLPGSQRAPSPEKFAVKPEERISGFSDPQVTAGAVSFRDYKLVTTKRDLREGSRYHLLQLATEKPLDIRDDSVFTKPGRLHRRDPRAPPPNYIRENEDHKDGLNAAEREELNIKKEARQKEREANLAQIAPSQSAKRVVNSKKKTQQVFLKDFTDAEKLRIQTNYEEKLPWHLEDFDSKLSFIGQNQPGSTSLHAAFAFEQAPDGLSARFRMIPVEKVYQFKPKPKELQTLSDAADVERLMKPRAILPPAPESIQRAHDKRKKTKAQELDDRASRGLFSFKRTSNEGRDGDLDYEVDEDFADDEEGDMFAVKDEDELAAEKKIKDDMLEANFLDFKDIKEYDVAEERERKEEEDRKENFRDLRKALEKQEANFNHGSDSEDFSSETTDSEEERERLEREKEAKLRKSEEAEARKSNINSSGTNTPSGRTEKKGGMSDREGRSGLPKSASTKSLKRPGSPGLSDASGTDASSRKKKKRHHLSSTQPTPGISRPGSPSNVPSSSAPNSLDPNSAKIRRRPAGGAGSDSDGGAMSDTTRIRIKSKIAPGLPPASGADAPSPPRHLPNRLASPPPRPASVTPMPTIQAIKDTIPPEGIAIKDLMSKLEHPKDQRKAFVDLIKTVGKLDRERTSWIMRRVA